MDAMLFATGIPYPEGPAFLPDGTLVVCARRDHYLDGLYVTEDESRGVRRLALGVRGLPLYGGT